MSTGESTTIHPTGAVALGGRLSGRLALVTGAAQGIGAAIARAFAHEGARVAVLDVQRDAVAMVESEIDGVAVVADLRDPVATRAAVAEAVDALGGLDILVNNAGVLRFAPFLGITIDDWDLTFDVNVRSMLVTMQAAAPVMIQRGGGRIINMASMGGKVGAAGQAHYCASKAAVISLTQCAATELGAHGINVNCICPGFVLTEMGAATRTPEMIREWTARSPLGRLGEPTDVARMALFLASEESAYCTGQAMNVTGGMVMH